VRQLETSCSERQRLLGCQRTEKNVEGLQQFLDRNITTANAQGVGNKYNKPGGG
jgi:hypothetical protein